MFNTAFRHFTTKNSKLFPIIENLASITAEQLSEKLNTQHNLLSNIDANGNTPLHLAARLGRCDLIPILVHHGANIEARDHQGYTPLKAAIASFNYSSIQVLQQHGACLKACGSLSGEQELALQKGQWWKHHGKITPIESLADALLVSKKPFEIISRSIQAGSYPNSEILKVLKQCISEDIYGYSKFLLRHLPEDFKQNHSNDLFLQALQHGNKESLRALFASGLSMDPLDTANDRNFMLLYNASKKAQETLQQITNRKESILEKDSVTHEPYKTTHKPF